MPGTHAARLQGLQVVIIIPVAAAVAMVSAPGTPGGGGKALHPHLQQGLQLLDLCEESLPALVLLSA